MIKRIYVTTCWRRISLRTLCRLSLSTRGDRLVLSFSAKNTDIFFSFLRNEPNGEDSLKLLRERESSSRLSSMRENLRHKGAREGLSVTLDISQCLHSSLKSDFIAQRAPIHICLIEVNTTILTRHTSLNSGP